MYTGPSLGVAPPPPPPRNIHGHFQSYFQNGYSQIYEATFAFYSIKLSH